MEVTGRSAESLEILARALHVKNAELQPTLEAIASTAVTMLSPARYAGLTVLSRGELIPGLAPASRPCCLTASSSASETARASMPPSTSPYSGLRTPARTSAGPSSARRRRD
jgi:hypothetical protein